jgi:triacylglycerol esterase/lipase EstA (alpha/beta hydrolase family)
VSRPSSRQLVIGAVLLIIAIIFGVVKLANKGIISLDRSPFDVKSEYLGSAPHNKSVAVVFVHGVFGTKQNTWFNQTTSFPDLLGTDPEFDKQTDIFLFEYYSPKFGSAASIPGLANQLRGSLEDHRVFEDHQKVIFLSHSMGGIVVRQYLLTKHDLNKVAMLYFYATPTNGSELTESAQALSSSPQLRGMLPLEGNDLLQSIEDGWTQWDATKSVPSYCAYETLPTYGVWVVKQSSARALCNEPADAITANHIEIVKPDGREDPRYSRFATAMRRSLSTELPDSMVNFSGTWNESIGGEDGGYVTLQQVGGTVRAYHAALGHYMMGRNLQGQGEKLFWTGKVSETRIEGLMYLTALWYDLNRCSNLNTEPEGLPFSLDLQSDGSLVGKYSIQNVWGTSPHCVLSTKSLAVKLVRNPYFDEDGNPAVQKP